MKRPLSVAAVVAILAFCAVPLVLWGGARLNVTSSFPPGIYWVVDKAPEKGDLVMFCPPQEAVFQLAHARGYLAGGTCPGGYMHLLKRLVAVSGDDVQITAEGVSVNGQLQVRSQPLQQDPSGRPMPQPPLAHFRLGSDEVLMLSDYSRLSFDGRYFGAVPQGQLGEVVEPWLVWRKTPL
ncbi:conjugative transfer signal peptidase TraF [Pseudomonas sp. ITEM 17296]|jgi:conjugative transfer signal peptidase TraF|uniref:conjugative transfer signal peptidase TraF n=1 Tax=Pseudomonas sp. ITEM 17296 TaxID=2790281 RepID=UPI0023804E9C|nr:conjugative transfer signal peptidase TraF [Pseudomonas sp. ITEM 17296]MDE4536801.1 conjugative transfer signal peptidase TraF [Pseudomonas sp. ITEM 17296]